MAQVLWSIRLKYLYTENVLRRNPSRSPCRTTISPRATALRDQPPAASADPAYAGLIEGEVTVNIADDDVAGVEVTPPPSRERARWQRHIRARLTSQPTDTVTFGCPLPTASATCPTPRPS
jgi:hypothetical protein